MQVTKELLDNDIRQVETQLEHFKASVANATGALSVLKNMRAYLDLPDPVVETAKTEISDTNKAIQDEVEAQIAKANPIEVTNAQGKYEEQITNG